MSIAIRLARGGSKKRPYYRIVVADSRAPRDGRFIEKVGTYNPLLAKDSPERVKLLGERISHWLSVGAQPSDRVARFLEAAGIRERAARNNPEKAVPGEKAKERVEERATKATAAEEAAAAAAAAPPEEPAAEEVTAEATPAAEPAPAAVEDAPATVEAAEQAPADTTDLPAEEPVAAEAATEASAGEEKPAEPVAPEAVEAAVEASAGAEGNGVSAPTPAEGSDDDAPVTGADGESATAPAEGEATDDDAAKA